jgi:hypothetical protein
MTCGPGLAFRFESSVLQPGYPVMSNQLEKALAKCGSIVDLGRP